MTKNISNVYTHGQLYVHG